MTENDSLSQNSSSNTHQQQEQKPFQIVLVDIERVVREHEIHCVEKSLTEDDDNLKYVAISYRWGELPETIVDTVLGYLASITSFDLMDFNQLCHMIYLEPDLQNINYVWIDAICIDQTNYERRKATVYQMSNIYRKAHSIVAVPDLHLRYLKKVNAKNNQVMKQTNVYARYIYELFHGNVDQLTRLDQQWLDRIQVPQDTDIRDKLLTTLYHQPVDSCPSTIQPQMWWLWMQQISQRHEHIYQCIDFLADLMTDWSSRVWVISEFHIAKEKNNMKYWFVQLFDSYREIKLFHFDFDDNVSTNNNCSKKNTTTTSGMNDMNSKTMITTDKVSQQFHQTMIRQLKQQSFLEIMLKSMASRSEDRFHAVLPLSKYKNLASDKNVIDNWNISGLLSVKLKLFELMEPNDKLTLLFLLANSLKHNRNFVFPTFATPTIDWPTNDNDDKVTTISSLSVGIGYHSLDYSNFDLLDTSSSVIRMSQTNPTCSSMPVYQLYLKPKTYYDFGLSGWEPTEMGQRLTFIFKSLELYTKNNSEKVHQVLIPAAAVSQEKDTIVQQQQQQHLVLAGSFVKNKWILFTSVDTTMDTYSSDKIHYCDNEYPSGFNIF